MTTVLQYLVIAAVIGLVVFGIAVFVFGRGEQMAALSPRTSPTELPDRDLSAEDVRKVRFAMALRGYRMSDVDWALEKLADELDRLRAEVAQLSGSAVQPSSAVESDAPLNTNKPVLAGVAASRSAGQLPLEQTPAEQSPTGQPPADHRPTAQPSTGPAEGTS